MVFAENQLANVIARNRNIKTAELFRSSLRIQKNKCDIKLDDRQSTVTKIIFNKRSRYIKVK